MKELVIIAIIITVIIGVDVATKNYTNVAINDIRSGLEQIEEKIKTTTEGAEKKDIIELANHIKNDWKNKYIYLTYFLEHNELEKVDTRIASMISNIENDEYNLSLNEADIAIFLLDHIKQKYELSIENLL